MSLGRRRRPRAFGFALMLVALSTRSFPAASAFTGRPAGRACCRRSVRSGAASKKPRHATRRRLSTGDEAMTPGWRGRPMSSGCCGPRSLRGSLRSQQGEGEGEGEEEEEEGEREAGAERRTSVVDIKGKGHCGVEDSEARGRSEYVDGGGGGGSGGGGNKGEVVAGKDDKERIKAERGRRILSTLDLVDTLVKSEVNLLEVLEEFSSTLRDENGVIQEERLVGEIARPVVARIRRYKTRDAYRRRQVAKMRGHELGPSRGAKALEEQAKPFPTTAAEIDRFLRSTKVTVWDAVRAYQVLTPGERIRRQKISLRWTDPVRWHADRMAENADQRQRRNDPAYLAEKREERRLRAVRRYETRRRNGNSGKGKPRSRVDQKKAEELAEARAAAIAAGLATEADFAPPPKRVPRKDIPTVKRRPGRPRKVLSEEERAELALREANGPRPRGRPRKLRVDPSPPPSPSPWPSLSSLSSSSSSEEPTTECHVTASLASIVSAWMADAAAQAAAAAAASGGLRSVASADALESHVKALAVAKTKEVTGAEPGGVWTPRMTRIALSGIEAWDEKWKEVFPGAADEPDAGGGAGGGLGLWREQEGGKCEGDAPAVSPTPEAPCDDSPAWMGSEGEEGDRAANAVPTAGATSVATMRPGLLAAKKAIADAEGGAIGGAAPSHVAPSAGVASGDGEEVPPPAEVAREQTVDASASKLSR